jgi:FKBP-type peptidyl-prolyl cis-trans isomerase
MNRTLIAALFSLSAACSGGTDAAKPEAAPADNTAKPETPAPAAPAAPADLPAPADVAAPPADVSKTTSGLAYKIVKPGPGGDRPTAESTVTVHYTGWTTDGKMFDSSVVRGKEAKFPLTRVIAGWTEGLQLMSKGDTVRFWIPEELAYKGQAGKPAGMLVFDVELIDFVSPPPVPSDVAAPPADAKKTASGLAYKVLQQGSGAEHPTAKAKVTVHYSGWTTDGKMFDSSVVRGRPAVFPLNGVIPGWTEGVALMVQGERTRFWIPEAAAYAGAPGKPAGMLVFDIELLSFAEPPAPGAAPAAPAAPAH